MVYVYGEALVERALGLPVWLVPLGLVVLVLLLNLYFVGKKRQLLAQWRKVILEHLAGNAWSSCLVVASWAGCARSAAQKKYAESARDPLTGIYGRRFFEDIMPNQARRCDRTGESLSFILIRLDDLKSINERFGHLVGDEVLRNFARFLNDSLRACDFKFRFGGDEFMIALPDTPMAGATVVATRLGRNIAEQIDLAPHLKRPHSGG